MPPVLAYFLTWTTYGTWLRVDDRGWAEIGDDGVTRYAEPDPERVAADRERLKHEPIVLSPDMRRVVDRAIRDGCAHRDWRLHALNVRSNHVHALVSANKPIDRALADLKAWGPAGSASGEWSGRTHGSGRVAARRDS